MTQTPKNLIVEIPASQLADQAAFDAARADAYKLEDPSQRAEALISLTESAEVVGGVALSDVVLEKLTSPEEAEAKDYASRAADRLSRISDAVATTKVERKHTEPTYRIEVTPNGTVEQVGKIVPIAEDKQRTMRTQKVMQHVGWGPKQNDTSKRLGGPVDPRSRH